VLYVRIDNSKNHRIPDHLLQGARISIWGTADYMELLRTHAEDTGLSLMACAQRYGIVSLLDRTQGWRFHPALGFTGEK